MVDGGCLPRDKSQPLGLCSHRFTFLGKGLPNKRLDVDKTPTLQNTQILVPRIIKIRRVTSESFTTWLRNHASDLHLQVVVLST